MLVASIHLHVRADKRGEFVSAVSDLLDAVRWAPGCLGCRLLTECEDRNGFVLVSEWDGRSFLNRHIESREFQILEGMRMLLTEDSRLIVDDVVTRATIPVRARR
jgi:quinol monooxygenase YgiN